MASPATPHLVSLLSPVIAATGADLEEVTVRPAGRRRLVRVVVDRDGGIDLDTVAELSRLVSDALDDCGALGDAPYVLEVTSPGVDRPLTQPRHWRRAVGRLVRCDLADGTELTGRLVAASGDRVDIEVGGDLRALRPQDVARAVVQVEFGPVPGGPDEE